jgi:hypothetical protein
MANHAEDTRMSTSERDPERGVPQAQALGERIKQLAYEMSAEAISATLADPATKRQEFQYAKETAREFEAAVAKLVQSASPEPREPEAWDASHIRQPGWDHVFAAFIEGAREARANPQACDDDFKRAADGYTKRVFEEVDPESERRLRTGDFGHPSAPVQPDPAERWQAGYQQATWDAQRAPPVQPEPVAFCMHPNATFIIGPTTQTKREADRG